MREKNGLSKTSGSSPTSTTQTSKPAVSAAGFTVSDTADASYGAVETVTAYRHAHDQAATKQATKQEITMSAKSERKKRIKAEKQAAKAIAAAAPETAIPHFTFEQVKKMLESTPEEKLYKGAVPIFTEAAGLLRFSDENGGTAYLIDDITNETLATFDAAITEELRQAKCDAPGCTCTDTKWPDMWLGCGHGEDGLGTVILYAGLCQNPKCTEEHIWILAQCVDVGHENAMFQLRRAA